MTGFILFICIVAIIILFILVIKSNKDIRYLNDKTDNQEERFMKLAKSMKVDYGNDEKKKKKKSPSVDPEFAADPTAWGHERLTGDILKPELEAVDPESPFYGKKIVFTGIYERHSRGELAEVVKKMGADVDTSVSRRTNFVVVGSEPGPRKIQQIDEFNSLGSNIVVLSETDLEVKIESFNGNNLFNQ